MFLRHRRVGRWIYTEALESYRSAGTIKHRCAARWHADLTLAQAIAKSEREMADVQRWAEYYDGVRARSVRPRFPKHIAHAAEYGADCRRRLALHAAQLAKLRAAAAHPEFCNRAPPA
jgi:hypothetical protein